MLVRDIETERLILREFRESDFDDVREYASDAEVARFTRFGPSDSEVTRKFLGESIGRQQEEDRQVYDLAAVLKSEGKLIGGCGLTLKDKNNGELGYILTRRYWGNGYATELARELLEFVSLTLDMEAAFREMAEEFHALGQDRFDEGLTDFPAYFRLRLTPALGREGGHIGYIIRPSERRKGYGTKILALTLMKAREKGYLRVMVTCDRDNVASAKIIEKNCGRYDGETISERTNKSVSHYWINLQR